MSDPLIFQAFPKIARLKRRCVVTEKIDGTNAQILINDEGTEIVGVGSRNRWLSSGSDNFLFYAWVQANKTELLKLGSGHHFGEWWGLGIQRGYGLTERRFSLFNVGRWQGKELPVCVSLVPILYEGIFSQTEIDTALLKLSIAGSSAAPGFMQPEGVVIFHAASSTLFKQTIEGDDAPKGTKEQSQ